MREKHLHVTDEQLLLFASQEVRTGSSGEIWTRLHIEGCASCKARLRELLGTLATFAETHRKNWEKELPSGAAPRALLTARLAELTARERGSGRRADFIGRRQWFALAGVLIACLVWAVRLHPIRWNQAVDRSGSMSASLGHWEEPDLQLTPGATVPVTANEVCGVEAEKAVPVVPVSLKRKVFEEYGVTRAEPDHYEVDYLITPELGGATDIRNLWPEPYQDTVWNAHVKDQLEDRLHRMVCRGDLDLATAQRDISSDWIAAYRKYFHAERPVPDGSSSNLRNPNLSNPNLSNPKSSLPRA